MGLLYESQPTNKKRFLIITVLKIHFPAVRHRHSTGSDLFQIPISFCFLQVLGFVGPHSSIRAYHDLMSDINSGSILNTSNSHPHSTSENCCNGILQGLHTMTLWAFTLQCIKLAAKLDDFERLIM